jgi:predicted ArsR family transcriptional regulator
VSWHAILAVLRWSRARPTARLVLLALAAHANRETNEAWPSVATLARETGLSARAVRDALRELEQANEIERLAAGGGRGRTARYRVNLARKAADAAAFGPTETRQLTHKTRQLTSVKGAAPAGEVVRNRKEPRAGDAAYGASPRACAECGAVTGKLEVGRCPSCYEAFETAVLGVEGAA